MQRFALSVCSRCRISLATQGHPKIWFTEAQHVARRFRSTKSNTRFRKRPTNGFGEVFKDGGYVNPLYVPKGKKKEDEPQISVEEVPAYLAPRVANWAGML